MQWTKIMLGAMGEPQAKLNYYKISHFILLAPCWAVNECITRLIQFKFIYQKNQDLYLTLMLVFSEYSKM